jgi:hypothetical protein
MGRKILWATLAAISVMAISGVGFAAFVASGTATITGTSGTTQFAYDLSCVGCGVTGSGSSPGSVMSGCTSASTSTTGNGGMNLQVTMNNMAPGDGCIVVFEIKNTGTLPGTWDVSVASAPGSCWQYLPSSHEDGALASGAETAPITMGLELTDNYANGPSDQSCEGVTDHTQVSISLTSANIGEGWETGHLAL